MVWMVMLMVSSRGGAKDGEDGEGVGGGDSVRGNHVHLSSHLTIQFF